MTETAILYLDKLRTLLEIFGSEYLDMTTEDFKLRAGLVHTGMVNMNSAMLDIVILGMDKLREEAGA